MNTQAAPLSVEELRMPFAQVNGQQRSVLRKPQTFKTPESTVPSSTKEREEHNSTSPSNLILRELNAPSIDTSKPVSINLDSTLNDENTPFPVMKRKTSPIEEDLDTSLNSSITKSFRRKVEPVDTKKPSKLSTLKTGGTPSLSSKFNNFSSSLRGGSSLSSSRLNQSMSSATIKSTLATTKGVAVKRTTAAAKKPTTTAASSSAKRPTWDLKGRLEDMEALTIAMREQLKYQGTTMSSLTDQLHERETKLSVANDVQVALSTNLEGRSKDMESLASNNRELMQTIQNMRASHQLDTEMMNSKARQLQAQLDSTAIQLTNCQVENDTLKGTIAGQVAQLSRLQSQLADLTAKLEASERLCQSRQQNIESLEETVRRHLATIDDLESKSRSDEHLRRQLHNQIQELKGNIRVFCRVRPGSGAGPSDGDEAQLVFPPNTDNKALDIAFNSGAGVTGNKTQDKKLSFKFDKVFQPASSQKQVFEEISQLVQSVLDGYNTCIFTYGQTGSGKTFTMEGPAHSLEQASLGLSLAGDEQRGMIPRTVEQIFATSKALESKGWKYEMEALFLEIYNESIRDLLCSKSVAADTKYDIKHDAAGGTSVTNMTLAKVSDPSQVYELLQTASRNRAVGRTNCNERSSRSHSVFQLQLRSHNSVTGEKTQGILNLIDLAGSERISQSGVTGDRLKETQAINKSLSSLADVICALANKDPHIPYRNSKLTFLLQNCLGGNSKTLMFVNVSPESKDLNESISSLRFATKVNACEIGTARKGGKTDLKM